MVSGWFDLHVSAPLCLRSMHDSNVQLMVCFVINMLPFFFKLHALRMWRWSLVPSRSKLPVSTWVVPLSSISKLRTRPTHYSSSSHPSYQIDCCGFGALVFKSLLFYLTMTLKSSRVVMLAVQICQSINFFRVKRCVCIGKNIVYLGFSALCGFRHPLGSWNIPPMDKRRCCNLWMAVHLGFGIEHLPSLAFMDIHSNAVVSSHSNTW